MSATISLPLLDQVRIANPCPARWEDMVGDARVRHCAQCDLDVHNISEMTRDEAEGVLTKLAEGCVCARFYRRPDGTILTRDCPVGIAAARAKLLKSVARIAAAIGLASLSVAAAKASQDKSWGNYGWSIRLANTPPVAWVAEVYRRASPSRRGLWLAGDISGPPGDPPAVLIRSGRPYGQGGTSPLGPHEWEYRE